MLCHAVGHGINFKYVLADSWFTSLIQAVRELCGGSVHYITTDTSLNFVRAFELYERRWGIEVIFKECRGYLGLGKCQSRTIMLCPIWTKHFFRRALNRSENI